MDTAYFFSGEELHAERQTVQRKASPLMALMDFYESSEDFDGDESEVDLMIQLSGMVGGAAMVPELN